MRTSYEQLTDRAAIMDEWRRLYAQSDARFFLSPAWIETLLERAPTEKRFGCVRAYDDLRGVYAMAIISQPPHRPFPLLREARLQESGDPALDRIYIEYNDILISRNAPDGARDAVVGAILDAAGDADQIIFRNSTPELNAEIESAARERALSAEILTRQPTFAIDLEALRGESVFDSFSSSLRAKIRRSIRRYEDRGKVDLQRPSSDAEKAIAWTELMRLHAETWSRRGLRGVFNDRAFSAFHERLLEKHPRAADFVRLTVGGETIGVLYNFIERGRVYNYQSGFKYEADNQLVPGFVCHALAAERYLEAGMSVYDMMGGEAEYKRRLGREGELLSTIAVSRNSLRTRVRNAFRRGIGARFAKTRQT